MSGGFPRASTGDRARPRHAPRGADTIHVAGLGTGLRPVWRGGTRSGGFTGRGRSRRKGRRLSRVEHLGAGGDFTVPALGVHLPAPGRRGTTGRGAVAG